MPDRESRAPEPSVSTGRLILWILVLVVLGMPMVYVLWSALNEILLGRLGSVRWALFLPVLAVFLGFLHVLSRLVKRWEGWNESSNGVERR